MKRIRPKAVEERGLVFTLVRSERTSEEVSALDESHA